MKRSPVILIACLVIFIEFHILPYLLCSESKRKIDNTKRRTALIIGNRDYRNTPLRSLKNPTRDADELAGILRMLGFNVVKKHDMNKKEMELSIKNFGKKLKGGGVGLFYYAGHGFQVGGINYLIPVGDIQTINSKIKKVIKKKAISVDRLLWEMNNAGNDFNIIILDTCRNNPFIIRAPIPIKVGFGKTKVPKVSKYGCFIVYATAPGEAAGDGEGVNGVFTEHLLEIIGKPGVELNDLMTIVTDRVREATRGKQTPWVNGWKSVDFYFNQKKIDLSKVTKMCDLPKIDNDVSPTDRKTIKKTAGAFGLSYDEAFAKAKTKVVRDYFKRCPSSGEYKNTVRSVRRFRERRMPDDSYYVEVTIEFYQRRKNND